MFSLPGTRILAKTGDHLVKSFKNQYFIRKMVRFRLRICKQLGQK